MKTGFTQQISMSGVESEVVVEVESCFDGRRYPPSCGLLDMSFLINKAGDAGVGRTCNGSALFYGTESCVLAVLPVAGCVAPPAIVGHDADEVGSSAYVFANIISVNGFVAYDRRCVNTVSGENCRIFTHA